MQQEEIVGAIPYTHKIVQTNWDPPPSLKSAKKWWPTTTLRCEDVHVRIQSVAQVGSYVSYFLGRSGTCSAVCSRCRLYCNPPASLNMIITIVTQRDLIAFSLNIAFHKYAIRPHCVSMMCEMWESLIKYMFIILLGRGYYRIWRDL